MQIKVNSLKHFFNKNTKEEFRALNDITVNFYENEFVSIIGHTGSGKTTFIEHLNGLIKPTDGEIIIGHITLNKTRKKIRELKWLRKKVGLVFQFSEYQLFEETVLKDIAFGPINMGISKIEAHKKAKHYLNLVGLSDDYLDKSPFELSGGQKRRVALAGILSMEPEYLICDEPTAGLDPEGVEAIYNILMNFNSNNNTTVIFITHDMDHVLKYSNRTLLFENGILTYDGNTIDLMYDKKKLEKAKLKLSNLADLVLELNKKGKKIGNVKSIKELIDELE